MSNTGSPRFTDFLSLSACSESSMTNLIGSGLNLLCLQSHSKTECRWTGPAGQRSRFLVLTKRSAASGNENDFIYTRYTWYFHQLIKLIIYSNISIYLIGSGLNLLCLQIHSKPECRWTGTEVAILGADQKERGVWVREWACKNCFRALRANLFSTSS